MRRLLPGLPGRGGARRSSAWLGRIIAFALLIAAVALRIVNPPQLEIAQLRYFDLLQSFDPRVEQAYPVTIVDVDERSLAAFGQWPWPRTALAEMIQRLMAAGAVVVGFDMVFPEPDRQSPAVFARGLRGVGPDVVASLESLPSNEQILAETLRGSRVVMGQATHSEEAPAGAPAVQPTVSFGYINGDPRGEVFAFPGLVRNLAEIEAAASGLGIFSVKDESDGVIRRVPALVRIGEDLFPSLALEMIRVATGQTTIATKRDANGLEGIVLAGFLIPTDRQGRIWVNYTRHDPARYLPAVDVLEGTFDPARVRGKLILVGTSAVGLKDIRRSPLDPALPGVEVHANIIETILAGAQLVRPPNADAVELMLTVGIGLLMIWWLPRIGPVYTLAAFLVVAAGIVGQSWYGFSTARELRDASFPLVVSAMIYLTLSYANYLRESREKRQVRGAFAQYLSPKLVEQLAANPDMLKLGGETKEMSIMFSDIRGFTTVSEMYKDNPQGLTTLINRLLTPLTDVIMARSGTIDKYMGDCVMAFWNAPIDDDRHADHALESALAMRAALDGLRGELAAEAAAEGTRPIALEIGIGINTGNVVVGNMGSRQRFDYSVLGDSVNLASRLEGQSKTYGVGVVVGEATVKRARDAWAFLELDLIAVKGKKEAARIFALLGDASVASRADFRALAERHAAMLTAFRAQDWTGAAAALADCRRLAASFDLGALYDLYDERIAEYRKNPPPADWDGVYVATSK